MGDDKGDKPAAGSDKVILANEGPSADVIDGHDIKEATQEHLNEVKKAILTNKISTKPEDYNYPNTALTQNDTAENILRLAMPKANDATRKRLAKSLEVNLMIGGANFDDVKANANNWRVENGTLIFSQKNGDTESRIVSIEILPWYIFQKKQIAAGQGDDTGHEAKEDDKEKPTEHHYDLSQHDGAPKIGVQATKIIAESDGTEFIKKQREQAWYEKQKQSASLLLELYKNPPPKPAPPRFSQQTGKYLSEFQSLLEGLTKQDTDPEKFYKDFEKPNEEELTGAKGLYNFLLTFQRFCDTFNNEDEIKNGTCKIVLRMGPHKDDASERFVRVFITPKQLAPSGEQPGMLAPAPDQPRMLAPNDSITVPATNTPGAPLQAQELTAPLYRGQTLSSGADPMPSAQQAQEQVNPEVASKTLVESYSKEGPKAVIKLLEKIPETQRQPILDKVFEQLGSKNPKAAFTLMQEIIGSGKEEQIQKILSGFEDKVKKAPDNNQKAFWQAQKLLFQAGQDENSEQLTREAFKLLSLVEPETLPTELKEMVTEQKQYLEMNTRQSLAVDMVETANMVLEGTMMSRKNKDVIIEDSWDEFKTYPRAKIAEELKSGMDQDVEVYMASSHVLEALRLLIIYRYPQDLQKHPELKEQLTNPVKFYYEKLKSKDTEYTTLKIPAGKSVPYHDVLNDGKKDDNGQALNLIAQGDFDVSTIFVNADEELRLFDEYQKGEEKLGEDSMYHIIVDDRKSFLEDKGGLVQGSESIFPPLGQLSSLMADNEEGSIDAKNKLGSVEKLEISKIIQLVYMKHYDEARALCIRILAEKLAKKKQPTDAEIDKKYGELKEKYGEKITAQVRLQLKEQGIDEEHFNRDLITRTDGKGGKERRYEGFNEYLTDRVDMMLHEMASLQLQGEVAALFTEAEASSFSQYEKLALLQLNNLNGNDLYIDNNKMGVRNLGLTAENREFISGTAKMIYEFILIEFVTAGVGGYFKGAVAAGKIGAGAATGGGILLRTLEGRPIRYLAEGGTWHARAAGHLLHGAALVEMQTVMHGENPLTWEKGGEILTTAATMGALSKFQQFMRGTTEGAKIMQQGGKLEGFANWKPIRGINQASIWLGKGGTLLETRLGKVGSVSRTLIEIGGETYTLSQINALEKWSKKRSGEILNRYDWGKNDWKDEVTATEQKEAWKEMAQMAAISLSLRTWGRAQTNTPDNTVATGRDAILPPAPSGNTASTTPGTGIPAVTTGPRIQTPRIRIAAP